MEGSTGTTAAEDRHRLALMRRICVSMFLAGGATSGVGVWTTQQTVHSKVSQGIVAGLFLLCGVGIAVARRPTLRTMVSMAVASMVILGVLVATSDPLGMAPIFFLWPVVLLAHFASARAAAAGYTVAIAALGVGLIANDNAVLRVDTFIGVGSSLGLLAWLISSLSQKEIRLRAELAAAADTDPLTGLLNRRAFYPQLERLVADALATGGRLSLVMFDLDHFKVINDRFGHAKGDEVLRHAASALRGTCRVDDLVARLGGEEFAVALPGAASDDALRFAARVATALRAAPDLAVALSTSAGSCCIQELVRTPDELLVRADEALYAAKRAGRSRAAVWDQGVTEVGAPFGQSSALPEVPTTDSEERRRRSSEAGPPHVDRRAPRPTARAVQTPDKA